MSKWIHVRALATIAQGATRYHNLNGDGQFSTETSAQARIRGTYTASNLWTNVTAVAGTCTLRTRLEAANGGQSLSITTTGTKEDTSGTDTLTDGGSGNLFNLQTVMTNTHGDSATLRATSVLLDDAAAAIAMDIAGTRDAAMTLGTLVAYYPCGGSPTASTSTESSAQLIIRVSTTLAYMRHFSTANSYAASTTYRLRNNGANGNQSLSYASSVTGEKEDTSNTDSISVGNTVNFIKESGGTSGNITFSQLSLKCSSSGLLLVNADPRAISVSASSTGYHRLCASSSNSVETTESNAQVKSRVANTFTNLQANISANGRSDATTVDFRAESASPGGGPAISVAASATGIKEDLTGTYTTATTDLINHRTVTGGGTGTITITAIGVQQGVPATPVSTPFQCSIPPAFLAL